MNDSNEIQWVKVYTSSDEQQVGYIRSLLEEDEIESVILNKKDSNYLIGEVELYVSTEDAFQSVQIINKFLK